MAYAQENFQIIYVDTLSLYSLPRRWKRTPYPLTSSNCQERLICKEYGIESKEMKSNFMTENIDELDFSQMIKVNINRNEV